jgi:hypothetical protein
MALGAVAQTRPAAALRHRGQHPRRADELQPAHLRLQRQDDHAQPQPTNVPRDRDLPEHRRGDDLDAPAVPGARGRRAASVGDAEDAPPPDVRLAGRPRTTCSATLHGPLAASRAGFASRPAMPAVDQSALHTGLARRVAETNRPELPIRRRSSIRSVRKEEAHVSR